MLYVTRDEYNNIATISKRPGLGANEPIHPEHPEVKEFLSLPIAHDHDASEEHIELHRSDLGLVRVFEDLIAVLIDKDIVKLGDLPERAQQKLINREKIRSHLKLQVQRRMQAQSDQKN